MKINSKAYNLIARVVDQSFDKGKINPAKVRLAIKTLSSLSINNATPSLSLFLKLFKAKLASQTLTIESPSKLTPDQISTIVNKIAETRTVYDTVVTLNPDLKFGLTIRIGDDIIEDNFRSRSTQIKETVNG